MSNGQSGLSVAISELQCRTGKMLGKQLEVCLINDLNYLRIGLIIEIIMILIINLRHLFFF